MEDQDRPEDSLPLSGNAERLLSLLVFLALSAALSWTVWLWPINHHLALITKFHGWRSTWPLYNIKLMIGGGLPGLLALAWVAVQGKQELRDLLASLFAWRTKFRWYALSMALPSLVFVLSAGAVLMLFPGKHGRLSALALVNTLLALPGVVSEEIAWRAFALRRLQHRYSRLASALIIGVYWAGVAHSNVAVDGEISNSCATSYNLCESYLLVRYFCLFIRTKRPEPTCHDSPPYNLHGGIKSGCRCGRISHCYHDSDRGSNLRMLGFIFRKTIGCQQPAQIQ